METIENKMIANGFAVIPSVYSTAEVSQLLSIIHDSESDKSTFRKTSNLFAIRQFLKEIPSTQAIIFNTQLRNIIASVFGNDYFVVKSIYFDKPENSNWFVAYHQDLTISVDRKMEIDQFVQWTVKQDQFAVQPPLHFLESNFTIRIHLDDTDENNGALKVIPGSHTKGIFNVADIDLNQTREKTCSVPAGGVMLMKPLLFHRSDRTTNQQRRRVIHIELSNKELPNPLHWPERLAIDLR